MLLNSACYLYKRQPVHRSNQSIRFQTLHHGQDQRAVQGCQGQDCRPTQGWKGLQDHRQAAWWGGDNSWCDYSQMEETQNNCQFPLDWGSMQDLTLWSFNDHDNGEESAQNYTGGSCPVPILDFWGPYAKLCRGGGGVRMDENCPCFTPSQIALTESARETVSLPQLV